MGRLNVFQDQEAKITGKKKWDVNWTCFKTRKTKTTTTINTHPRPLQEVDKRKETCYLKKGSTIDKILVRIWNGDYGNGGISNKTPETTKPVTTTLATTTPVTATPVTTTTKSCYMKKEVLVGRVINYKKKKKKKIKKENWWSLSMIISLYPRDQGVHCGAWCTKL